MIKMMESTCTTCDCCKKIKPIGDIFRIEFSSLRESSGYQNMFMCSDCIIDLKKEVNNTFTKNIEKKENDIKMIMQNFANLESAWTVCVENVSSALSIEVNDFICGEKENNNLYPFDQSFDELNVSSWINGIQEKCKSELNRLEELKTHFS